MKELLTFLPCFAALCAFGDATVSDVTVTQLWPFSTDLKITYTLAGASASAPVNVTLDFFDGSASITKSADYHNAVKGDLYGISSDGVKSVLVDAKKAFATDAADFPRFKVTVTPETTTAETANEVLYKIFDLTKKGAAACTDVTRSDLLNGKYGDYETSFQRIASHFKTSLTNVLIWTGVTNGTVYKTSKLVMRKIPAKDVVWTIGSPDGEKGKDYTTEGGREAQHTVKLTENFYIGVFELTQYQYSLCPGSSEGPHYTGYSDSDLRPAENISPKELRGWQDLAGQTHSSEKIMWPTNSYQHDVFYNRVFGKMRSKFGVDFDLPTEAQWEFACRAGTSTGLNSGYDITNCDSTGIRCPRVDEVCWNEFSDYSAVEPTGTPHTMPVGMKKPNAYGLYDMHGNVEEVCQDFMYNDISTYWDKDGDGFYTNLMHTDTAENPLIDPVGAYNANGNKGYTTARGGSYCRNNRYVRSAYRESGHRYADGYYYQGYRLACPVGAHWIEANRNK